MKTQKQFEEAPLMERFQSILPDWMKEIKTAAFSKIRNASFVALCREGSIEVCRSLNFGLWPFVNEFPLILNRGNVRLAKLKYIRRFGISEMRTLIRLTKRILLQIQQDEEEHRDLWLKTGKVLGLQYPAGFEQETLPEVTEWIEAVGEESDPLTMFLRFAAIEIIAEGISTCLLSSHRFKVLLGERGSQWFHVHVIKHGEMSHEVLSLKLGFAFHDGAPTKDQCSAVIQEIIDLYLRAAEACVVLVRQKVVATSA